MNRLTAQIANFAPLVASALEGPLAGIATSLIAHMFNADPKNPDGISEAINKDTEAIDKLKLLEIEHKEELQKIASHNFEIHTEDVKHARQSSVDQKKFMHFLAIIITVGFFASIAMLFIPLKIPEFEKQLMSVLVGMLVSKFHSIIDFYFGSSSN